MTTWQRDLLLQPVVNPEGVKLMPYGVQTSEAHWLFFVCFDDHPLIGRMVHVFPMKRAREFVELQYRDGEPLSFGSTERNPFPNTGAGFLAHVLRTGDANVYDLKARSFALSGDPGGGPLGTRSERAVENMLVEWGVSRFRRTNRDEQIKGVDLVCKPLFPWSALSFPGRVQVKSRGEDKSSFLRIFIQTHEINVGGFHD